MKKRTTLDLTEGPILRKLLMFALPLMFNSVIDSLYSTADTVMMGRFAGTEAMAAVGASGQPINLLVTLFAGIALGVNVTCANLRGARKGRELRQCMYSSVLTGLLAGCLVAVVGLCFSRPLLQAMDTPKKILDDAALYMNIRLASGPVWLLSAFCVNIFYAHGDTRTPAVISLASGLVNVGLNVVFVPVMGMGVEGVALATDASLLIKAAVLMGLLFSPKGSYQLRFSELRLRTEHVRRILSVGIPAGLNSIVFSISNVLLQSAVNSFGTLIVAANTAADNLGGYVSLIMNSFVSACLSGASQCFGARKYKRIDQLMVKALLGSILMVAAAASVITAFSRPLLLLFDSDPKVAEAGLPKLMFLCWGYMIFSVTQVYAAGLKGIRKATPALVCTLLSVVVPRLLWVWLVIPKMHTPAMLYLIYPISWAISAVVLACVFYHYRRALREPSPLEETV